MEEALCIRQRPRQRSVLAPGLVVWWCGRMGVDQLDRSRDKDNSTRPSAGPAGKFRSGTNSGDKKRPPFLSLQVGKVVLSFKSMLCFTARPSPRWLALALGCRFQRHRIVSDMLILPVSVRQLEQAGHPPSCCFTWSS